MCKRLRVWVVQTRRQVGQYEILNMRRASWSVHRSSPTIRCGNKIHIKQKMEKMKEQKSIFASLLGFRVGFGNWTRTDILGVFVPGGNFILFPFTGSSEGNAAEEGMKTDGKNWRTNGKKKKEKKKVFHIPLVLCFHGNSFHNAVTVKSASGAAYVFLTRLRPHKRSQKGTQKGKRKEKGLHREIRGWVTRGK